jgi:transposase
MTNQAPELTGFDLIEWRKAKMLELHSQGLSEREIADKLKVSKTTVHNDLMALRLDAKKQLQEHIEGLPHAWQMAHTSVNMLIKKAWELAERKGLEFDQEVKVIDVLDRLTENRLKLFADPSIIDATVRQKEVLQKELDQLRKAKPGPYEVESTFTPSKEKGKKGTVERKIVPVV